MDTLSVQNQQEMVPEYPGDNEIRLQDFYCEKCGDPISRRVWQYSVEKFMWPLCYKCQKIVRAEQRGGRW